MTTTMKNYNRIISSMLALFVVVLFSACDDDAELFTISSSPTAPVLAELAINSIELDALNVNNPAATFNWTAADYGQQASVNYSLQFAMDQAFTTPVNSSSVTGNNTVTLNVNELNSAAGDAGLNAFVWTTLYVRVVSSLGTQGSNQLTSNVISIQVYPFFNYPFQDFYLVGDGTAPGWNNNNNNPAVFRDPNNSNVFNYTGFFTAGHFKLLEVKGLWQPQWGTNDGSTAEVNDGTGSDPERFPTAGGSGITSAGLYSFTIDFGTNSYTFEPFSGSAVLTTSSLTIQGSALIAPVPMVQSSFDSNIFYANTVRLTPGSVEFLTDTNAVWGGTTEFSGVATAGGGSINVPVEDDYDVWFNALTGQYILIPLNL
jgi:hypothetical protein